MWGVLAEPRVTEAAGAHVGRRPAADSQTIGTHPERVHRMPSTYPHRFDRRRLLAVGGITGAGAAAGLLRAGAVWATAGPQSYTAGIGHHPLNAMLHSLIDRVSKNGTMLLDIAPMAEGTIPSGQRTVLLGIGDYLRRFGESIYATRAWSAYGEGPTQMGGGSFDTPRPGTSQDIRFTRNKANTILYATVLGWPAGTLNIATLSANRINLGTLSSVQMLGSTAGTYLNLPTRSQDGAGLHVMLPSATAPFAAPAYVVKLTFSGQIPALAAQQPRQRPPSDRQPWHRHQPGQPG
jgi:hypothetical protein